MRVQKLSRVWLAMVRTYALKAVDALVSVSEGPRLGNAPQLGCKGRLFYFDLKTWSFGSGQERNRYIQLDAR